MLAVMLMAFFDLREVALLHFITKSNFNCTGCKDWEDLAMDEQFLYIGDFGNNGGNRQDMLVYKVALSQINPSTSNADMTQSLSVQYEDQTTFDNEAYKHNFDCEAMIVLGDSLYWGMSL